MDEKSDIDIGLNEVIVPKNKQGSYGSKDYLHNLELSTAPLEPNFGVASHFISSYDGKTDGRIKPNNSISKTSLLAILER